MKVFGNGPTLREACIWLRDPNERHRRIIDAAERNSVIEGLPPFSNELRERLLQKLAAMSTAAPASVPPAPEPASDGSPS